MVTESLQYISIVVTSRNDNHGNGLLFRMQTFVNCLLDQCQRHRLAAELIIVEWNPPNDRLGLGEALRWPTRNSSCPVRIIRVPCRIHVRFPHAGKLPLFQMIAKNVGIRRARAPFVLVTNIHILFSEHLVAYLATKRLKERFLYRANRCDVPADLPVGIATYQLLDFCRKNVVRVHKRWGSMDARTRRYDEGSVTW